MFRELLNKLSAAQELSTAEIAAFIAAVGRDELSDIQLSAFLMALLHKGVTASEITAIALAMRAHSIRVQPQVSAELLDTCGTGGGLSTFNISTASAILCAAAGIPVAKHGSRSLSSLCGSADVLEALGVQVHVSAPALAKMIEDIGIAFIYAADFNPVMRRLLPIEAALGIKTVFYTLIGPLINPALASRHLLGVYRPELLELTLPAVQQLGLSRVMLVHGLDGVDEISLLGPSRICYLQQGVVSEFEIKPEDFGLARCRLDAIASQVPLANAALIRDIFAGKERGAARDAVLLNSAGALMVGGCVNHFAQGIELAKSLIDDGLVLHKLRQLAEMSHDVSAVSAALPLPVSTQKSAAQRPEQQEATSMDSGEGKQHCVSAVMPAAQLIWQGILDASADGIVLLDNSGKVLVCNDIAAAQLGTTTAQMQGQDYCLLLPPGLQATRQQQIALVKHSSRQVPWEDADQGQYYEMKALAVNEGRNLVLFSRNINEHKRLQASEQNKRARLKTLIETLPDLIWLKDSSGRYLNCNRRFERFLGVPEVQIKGKTEHHFLPKELADVLAKDAQQVLEERRAVVSRLWIEYAGDGHKEFVEIIQTPFFDQQKQLSGVLGIARDVTDFNATEQELRRHRDQLEQMVEQRTADLSKVVAELRKAQNQLVEAEKVSALGAVVAGLSHEMNTPVGNILTLSSALLGELAETEQLLAAGTLSKSRLENHLQQNKEMLLLAEKAALRTARLINDFKQVASDQVAEQRHIFALHEVLHASVAALKPEFDALKLKLELNVAEAIYCDSFPGAVGQIIGHLLQNVVNHAFLQQEGKKLAITALVQQNELSLCISDNGVGMDIVALNRVFNPFFTTNMSKGAGIGLAVCKRLAIGVLGGDLTASSESGQGCTFTLRIPLTAPGYRIAG